MRKALWLFTPFAALASLPCFATAVTTPQTVAVDPLTMAEAIYPELYSLVGTWDTEPYDGPVQEGEGFGFSCCTAELSGPYGINEAVPAFTVYAVTSDATAGVADGYFDLAAQWDVPGQGDYYLTANGGPVPLVDPPVDPPVVDPPAVDPPATVPEPNFGWLVGSALAAFIIQWEFRRRRAARDRKMAAVV